MGPGGLSCSDIKWDTLHPLIPQLRRSQTSPRLGWREPAWVILRPPDVSQERSEETSALGSLLVGGQRAHWVGLPVPQCITSLLSVSLEPGSRHLLSGE